ncbi:MAG TPA: hypothetical protein VK686_04460 [Bryobacteraceae bacterium]|nr:hypothetical protein [Bryobacteraceae bacterium]
MSLVFAPYDRLDLTCVQMAPLDFVLLQFRFGGKRYGTSIVYGCNEPPKD